MYTVSFRKIYGKPIELHFNNEDDAISMMSALHGCSEVTSIECTSSDGDEPISIERDALSPAERKIRRYAVKHADYIHYIISTKKLTIGFDETRCTFRLNCSLESDGLTKKQIEDNFQQVFPTAIIEID